jgi:1,4-alpha-glucan branching enzyme
MPDLPQTASPTPTAMPDPQSDAVRLDAAMAALLAADHGDPFAVLGPHVVEGRLVIRAVIPGAARVLIVDPDGVVVCDLPRVHPDGGFAGTVPEHVTGHGRPFPYRLRAVWSDGDESEFDDAYRFAPVLGDLDLHLLAEGRHLRAWERLGAHPRTLEGVDGVAFAVWAPNARKVSVVGDFDGWDGRRLPMRLRHGAGVWELFVPGVGPGARYKFEIKGPHGEMLPLKADPVGFLAEHPPATASVVADLPRHAWADGDWMEARSRVDWRASPISIYEVHLPSWKRGDGNRYLSYRELADDLVPYVVEMGFTHVELLPITEYPFDGSWGYQPVGLYAPTCRLGDPDDLRAFMDACHRAGIGVLMDWVPGHFPSDAHGLALFDGTHLYEHADPRQGFHQDWNTLIYNFGRQEVANHLLGSALYWLEAFHMDGLRVDAVASMLYLDYSRQAGQWVPNAFGGNENLDAIAFLRRMNELAYGQHAGVMTVAEESTAWPAVSRPVYLGGLGFGFKWNMGWMHDTLRYMGKDPIHRRYHHHDLTFGLLYAFTENFVLPLSHDEVVHGKGSLWERMPGDPWRKAANLRAYLAFMWTHPGKKLLFMGGEFGQEREWNHDRSLDWHLLSDPLHEGVRLALRDLNRLYRAIPALHERDCEPDGFAWIEANDSDSSALAYLRRGRDGRGLVVVVINFTPIPRHAYRVGVPEAGRYVERLNTDAALYGGSDMGNGGAVAATATPHHGRPFSLALTLPPLGALVFQWEG